MRFYGDVIARKGKKYWIGRIKRGKFHETEELELTPAVERIRTKCITIYEYAKIIGLDLSKKQIDDIRKKTGYTEIWVVDKEPPKPNRSGEINNTSWERWLFRFYHPLCQRCVKECKQSSRVDLMCPNFEEKK